MGNSAPTPIPHTVKDADECKKLCNDDDKCHAFTFVPPNVCWKQVPLNSPGWKTAFKNDFVTYKLPDRHPFITSTANGPRPEQQSFRSPVTINNVTCQDCGQQLQDVSTSQSEGVNFSQAQNCIINLEKKEKAAAAASPPPSSALSPTPSASPSATTPPATPSATTSEPSSTGSAGGLSDPKTQMIVGGVTSVICLISIIIAFVLYKRNNKTSK